MAEQLWGGETTKAVENFQDLGPAVPAPVIHWLGRLKAAGGARQRRARQARRRGRRADRRGRRRGRRGRARRPVPDRRLPDRLGHLVEHERERGDRQPRRRRGPPQRPRQHGPVLERRLPLGGPPGGAGRGALRPAAGAGRAGLGAGAQGRRVRRPRQGRPHPPDGRGPGHPRPGVRRLRRAGQARSRAGRATPRPGGPDPARRHGHRHRPQHPPEFAAKVREKLAADTGLEISERRPTPSRRRATATRWWSSAERSRPWPSRSSRSPTTWR